MSSREATALVIERMRARPGMVGAAVFGTALTVPFAASAAWATNICACGGGSPTAAPAPPTPDVSGMSADAAERWIESAAPPPAHPPAPAPAPSPTTTTTTAPPVEPEPVEPEPVEPEPEPVEPPPDVSGMSADAAERWLAPDPEPEPVETEPEPVEPEPVEPQPVEEGPPTGTTTSTTVPPEPEHIPAPAEEPPDVSGMTPDAAERWLEAEPAPAPEEEGPPTGTTPSPPPEPAPPPVPEVFDPERDERFDPAPGCIPVQGPYMSEADRPCSFPDGTQIPTGQIGTQPEEARPCVPAQGPYLNEGDRPCAFPDGREIPSGVVVEPPPPYAPRCEPVEGYENEVGLCAYPDGRTSMTDDPQRTPAPPVEDFNDLAEGGRGEELVAPLLEPTDEEFQELVDEGTIGEGATNRSYFPIEPAPGDGVVVLDFFIPQDRSVVLRGDDRELQDPIQADLEPTDSRITVVLDRESGRGVLTQSETCTVGIEICQAPRPIEFGPEDDREQAYPNDPNEFDLQTDEETISLSYDALNSITPEGFSVDGTVRLRRRPDGLYQVVHDTRDEYPAISIWQYRPGDTPRLIDYDRGEHVLEGAVPDCDLPAFDPPGSWFDFLKFDGPNLPPIYGVCR
jgi:hypothetical protein